MPARDTLAVGEVVVQNVDRTTKLVGAGELVVRLAGSSSPNLVRAHATVKAGQAIEDPNSIIDSKRPETSIVGAPARPVTGEVKQIRPSPSDHCADVAFGHTILELGVRGTEAMGLRLTITVGAKLGGGKGPVVGVILEDLDAVEASGGLERVLALQGLLGLLRELSKVEDFPTGMVHKQSTARVTNGLLSERVRETADRR
mmetsp:Transcript_30431/g.69430  ORF Transcript_30431/g.69430 Transcript_30431/m.69430 type:complete len:201 (+) Transcript_30431:2719-3321(+)